LFTVKLSPLVEVVSSVTTDELFRFWMRSVAVIFSPSSKASSGFSVVLRAGSVSSIEPPGGVVSTSRPVDW